MRLKKSNIEQKNTILKTFQNHLKLTRNFIRGSIRVLKKWNLANKYWDFDIRAASVISFSTLAIFNQRVGLVISSSTALLTSIARLMTSQYLSKLKILYSKTRNWIMVIRRLYGRTLKTSMVYEKISWKRSFRKYKRFYNHYFDKRKEKMKNTQFKVEYKMLIS